MLKFLLVGNVAAGLRPQHGRGNTKGISGSSPKGLLCWKSMMWPCCRHDYNFQNEFSLSLILSLLSKLLIPIFCDDWFLNQKSKKNEKDEHTLSCPLPQAPREMPEIFLQWRLITLDHQVQACLQHFPPSLLAFELYN